MEIGIKLVSLLHSCFCVKQARIELSWDDDRHRVVKDRIYHERSTTDEKMFLDDNQQCTRLAAGIRTISFSQCERDFSNLAGQQFPKTAGLLIL